MVWFGLVWFGLVWFGLVWFGLVLPSASSSEADEEKAAESAQTLPQPPFGPPVVALPAWGAMCGRLRDALAANQTAYGAGSGDEEALAFVAFFAAPIDGLDEMAAAVIDAEDASFDDVVEDVRLLQEYELEFWDAIFAAV